MDQWSNYQQMPHDQVNWADLAQQWMAMKAEEPSRHNQYDHHGHDDDSTPIRPIFPSAGHDVNDHNQYGNNSVYNANWSDGPSHNHHNQHPLPPLHQHATINDYPPVYPSPHTPPSRDFGGYSMHNKDSHGDWTDGNNGVGWFPPPIFPFSMDNMPQQPPQQQQHHHHGYRENNGRAPPSLQQHHQQHQPPQSFFSPNVGSSPIGLDANARKKLPAWILEGLDKADREKQKQLEKDERIRRAEEEKAKRRALAGKGKFDSSSDEEDSQVEEKKSTSSRYEEERGRIEDDDDDDNDEKDQEKRENAMICVKHLMMALLIEITDEYMRSIVEKCMREAKTEAEPKLLVKSSALAALSSLGEADESDSESDVDDGKKEEKMPPPTSKDNNTFKVPTIGMMKKLSKPEGTSSSRDNSTSNSSTAIMESEGNKSSPEHKSKFPLVKEKSDGRRRDDDDDSFDKEKKKKKEDSYKSRKRSRSRSREKRRSGSRDRKRSRSRDRKSHKRRSRSKDRKRDRSRSRDRRRSSSRERKRSRSRERRRR